MPASTHTSTYRPPTTTIHPPLQLPQLPFPLPQHLYPLLPHNRQDSFQTRPPRIQPALHLGPLLLPKDAIRAPMDEEGLVELGELALHEPRSDHVNHPHLHVLAGDLQRAGDVLVRQTPARRARGQRSQREQAHLPVQDRRVRGDGREEVFVGFDKVVVVVQQVRVEYFEQFIPFRIRPAERLDRVARGEFLEVEMRGVEQCGFQRAEGEAAGFGGGDVFDGYGAQGSEQIEK